MLGRQEWGLLKLKVKLIYTASSKLATTTKQDLSQRGLRMYQQQLKLSQGTLLAMNKDFGESSLREVKQEGCHEFKASLNNVARPALKRHVVHDVY